MCMSINSKTTYIYIKVITNCISFIDIFLHLQILLNIVNFLNTPTNVNTQEEYGLCFNDYK